MSQSLSLSRPFPARDGAPVLQAADPRIFTFRYFTACLSCTFCNDACCNYGVDVDAVTVERILGQADVLETIVGLPRSTWFEREFTDDDDFAGGRATRTTVVDGACVFRSRKGRGCLLHAHALETGQDYHRIKPIVSALFPVTFSEGLLCIADEIEDGTLVCGGSGPSVYEGARGELAYYFGDTLVAELDALARHHSVVSDMPSAP